MLGREVEGRTIVRAQHQLETKGDLAIMPVAKPEVSRKITIVQRLGLPEREELLRSDLH